MVNRLTRLLTAVVLARALGPVEFGIAAVALTASDLVRVLTQTGIGARILSASEAELESICLAARRLNWFAYGGAFALHNLIAWPVAQAYGDPLIGPLIAALAVPLLAYPLVSVQVFRIQRAGRIAATATMQIVLISGDNLLTAVFAAAGLGLWSLVLPKFIVAAVWVAVYRRLDPWKGVGLPSRGHMRSVLRFGGTVFGAELCTALRNHGDKLLIGQLAGLAVLGQYYFAANAGLGITTALITACGVALLPHFAGNSANQSAAAFFKATGLLYLVLLPVFAAQIGLAPLYVPIVFGAQWADSVPLLMILCASGIPFVLWRTSSLLIRAKGAVGREAHLSLALAVCSLAGIVIAAPHGLEIVAWCLLAINTVFALAAAAVALTASTTENKP